MPTALVKDVLYRASVLAGDASPQFTAHTERAMVGYLNDGQVAIAKIAPWACNRVDSIKLAAGRSRQSIATVQQSDMLPADGSPAVTLRGLMLTELHMNMGADGQTEGNAIRLVSGQTLTASRPEWPTRQANGVEQYVFDARYPTFFLVSPRPVSAWWVLASYQSMPVEIPAGGAPGSEIYAFDGGSTQTITIDDRFQDDLVLYIAGRCKMEEVEGAADIATGSAYMSAAMSNVKGHAEVMMAMNPALKRS